MLPFVLLEPCQFGWDCFEFCALSLQLIYNHLLDIWTLVCFFWHKVTILQQHKRDKTFSEWIERDDLSFTYRGRQCHGNRKLEMLSIYQSEITQLMPVVDKSKWTRFQIHGPLNIMNIVCMLHWL